MQVMVNEQSQEVSAETTLQNLLDQLGYQQQSFAVAINETFVSKNAYATTRLQDNDQIEIVAPMQGG